MPTPVRIAACTATSALTIAATLSGCSSTDDHASAHHPAAGHKAPPTVPTRAAPGCSPQSCARTEDYPPVTVYLSGFHAEKHPEANILGASDGKVAHKITFTWW
ncbi:hypothetical protein [Actinomadura opuntiae]|uniref:hypothetical protein n=1 Tax=Actinomadura sp. OS1-43 TaxID=604315 RepID=UPI00255A8F66|nr:hypothetical protein [Actinomadura sp. OS1-43]MDL4818569.1 hypothetical protein [Actinomadura sp. OS1-43]